jgi:hypothetical protein
MLNIAISSTGRSSRSTDHPLMLPTAVLTSNSSIIPYTDKWLADVCYTAPCTNATLTQAATTIISGCAADLTKYNVTNATIYDVVGQYPLAREVACLKT